MRRFKRFAELPHGFREGEIEWDRGAHVVMVKTYKPRFPDTNSTETIESIHYETTSGVFIKANNWERGGIEPVTEFGQLEAEAAELRITNVLAGKVDVIQPPAGKMSEPLTEKQKDLNEIQEHFDKIQADFAEKEKRYQDRIKEIAEAETRELKLERLSKVRGDLDKEITALKGTE